MTTLPNMGIELPILGADEGEWDDKINAAFRLVDAHDHEGGKGLTIPVASLDIDADLPMSGFGITAVGRVAFSTIAALTTGSKSLFVSSADNELYWRSNAGVNVKLTSASSINTSLVGGIVGDYASVGAEVAYDDANQRYTFKNKTSPGHKWARLACGPVRIFEYDTTESAYVEHAVDAALAAPYTVTWPAALPGTAALVQISTAGILSYSLTLPTNTVLKHASQSFNYPVNAFAGAATSGTLSAAVTGDIAYASLTASGAAVFPITGPLKAGDRITSIVVTISGAGTPTPTIGAITGSVYAAYTTTSSVSIFDYTLTVTSPTALLAAELFALRVSASAGGSINIVNIKVFYDRP